MSHNVPAGNRLPLETGRLVLRPLSADDVDPLHRISNEPMVRLYLWDDQPVSEATINGLIAHSDRMFSKENVGLFGVRLRGREDLLGFCGFVCLEGMEEPELCYELTQKMWGVDIATQAAQACLRLRGSRPGARDRRRQGAQHHLPAGNREARHEVLREHQPERPGRTLLCAVQRGVLCGDGDGLTTYE